MKFHSRCLTFLFLSLALATSGLESQDNLVRVSGTSSPFANCSVLFLPEETSYVNAEVEPWIAADKRDPRHLIGVWQQDRWQFGGARGLLTGVSRDGGETWTHTFASFSRCSGGNPANGGDYERASDPWVTISPDGVAYQSSLSFDQFDANNAVSVSRSTDGGNTWSDPVALIRDTDVNFINDKESITADPRDSHLVYAVWGRVDCSVSPGDEPVWFSRTTDGGTSWERARIIFDPGPGFSAIVSQLVVLPDGTLLNVFSLFQQDSCQGGGSSQAFVAVIRSQDRGISWSQPVFVNTIESIGVSDVKTGRHVRAGVIVPVDVNHVNGALYVVWQDARFSGFQRDGIVLSKSTDGGFHWSPPVQVNQAPLVQAFTPAIAVGRNGSVAVNYYDFRNDTADPSVLLTNYWQITSHNGGATWKEIPVAGPFDLLTAPRSGGLFVGDYEGLVQIPKPFSPFSPFFVMTNSENLSNRTDVFTTIAEGQGDTLGNGHEEINLQPQTIGERILLYREIQRARVPR